MAATAPDKIDSVAMPIAAAASNCINAVAITKTDLAVDGNREPTTPSISTPSMSSSHMKQRPTKRSDISSLISHELTEMEKCIDDDSDNANNNTKNNPEKNKSISVIKSTNSTDLTSMSTSIGSARETDCVDTNTKWDKTKSTRPLHRLFTQSHANDMTECRRCDNCVQIPIEHIELVEDDEKGMIVVHDDVSSVQSSASCFSVSVDCQWNGKLYLNLTAFYPYE